jgi:negative regulator of replication initiation
MPTIRIDEEVWGYLKTKATPFEDTPNDVLRRELKIIPAPQTIPSISPQNTNRTSLRADKDYSYFPIKGYRLGGKFVGCRSFAKMITNLSSFMWLQHMDSFAKVALDLHGKKRPYFSKDRTALRKPHKLPASEIFVETNLSANNIVAICRVLVEKMGYGSDSLIVE